MNGDIPLNPMISMYPNDSCPMCHKPFREKEKELDRNLLTEKEKTLLRQLTILVEEKKQFLDNIRRIVG